MNRKPVSKRSLTVVVDTDLKKDFDNKLKKAGLTKQYVITRLMELFNSKTISL